MGQIDTIMDIYGTEPLYSKHYFNNVFKKTEKIVSAVFFILNRHETISNIKDNSQLAEEMRKVSLEILVLLSETLLDGEQALHIRLLVLTRKLLLLNGHIQVAMSADSIAPMYGSIISSEIMSLIGVIGNYRHDATVLKNDRHARQGTAVSGEQTKKSETRRAEKVISATDNGTPVKDRKEIIIDILKEKGQVSIKDISDVVKDVSEKSIQRDLQSLIEKGQVIRHGERRWSTYTLV